MNSFDEEWAAQPVDPDPADDLGYEIESWDVVRVDNADSDHLVFLPEEEEMLKRDAFLIVPTSMALDLDEHQ